MTTGDILLPFSVSVKAPNLFLDQFLVTLKSPALPITKAHLCGGSALWLVWLLLHGQLDITIEMSDTMS
jgi:hypothetical protein